MLTVSGRHRSRASFGTQWLDSRYWTTNTKTKSKKNNQINPKSSKNSMNVYESRVSQSHLHLGDLRSAGDEDPQRRGRGEQRTRTGLSPPRGKGLYFEAWEGELGFAVWLIRTVHLVNRIGFGPHWNGRLRFLPNYSGAGAFYLQWIYDLNQI